MSFTVLQPGLHSILVDPGRFGARHLGMPVGGAADALAYRLGNTLVGNQSDEVALEVGLSGPILRAEKRVGAILFGAPFEARIRGRRSLEPNTGFTMEPGDILQIGGTPTLARAYLCVPGGFESPELRGSRSAWEPLVPEQRISCRESCQTGLSMAYPGPGHVVRVLPGPQIDWFMNPALFVSATYQVQPASNRMGLRLQGPALERRPGELVSEPVAPGAVQITNDGQPVILGVDGQTIGGYPKIAHVIRADLHVLGQLRTCDLLQFQWVDEETAREAARQGESKLREWLLRIAARRS